MRWSQASRKLQPQAPPLLLTGGLRPQATPYAFQHSATGHVLQPSAKEFWRNKSSYETMASQSTTSSPTDDVTELPDGLPRRPMAPQGSTKMYRWRNGSKTSRGPGQG